MGEQFLVINYWFFVRNRLKRALALLRQSCVEAACGETALRTLISYPAGYSLVLIDLNTPGINGPDLLKIIKQDERLRHLKVIIVAENLSLEVINDLLSKGADGCLDQNLSPSQLKEALTRACQS